MFRIRLLLILASACLAAGCLTACGGSSGDVVAKVGSTAITKAEVDHWMTTLAGGDYYEVSRNHTLPAGLVSDPPNYARCVATLEATAGSSGPAPAKPSTSQLLSKCRLLEHAVKQQATAYLVEAQWLIALGRNEGVVASDQDIKQVFAEVKKQEFTSERKLRRFLTANRRSLADELFVVKLDFVRRELAKKQLTGAQMRLKLAEDGRIWTAKTTCRAGYVVAHCAQYTPEPSPNNNFSAAVLLEQVAAITGSAPCIGRARCT